MALALAMFISMMAVMMVEMMKIQTVKSQTCKVEGQSQLTYNISEQIHLYSMVQFGGEVECQDVGVQYVQQQNIDPIGEQEYSITEYFQFECKKMPWKVDGMTLLGFSLAAEEDSRAIGKYVDSREIPEDIEDDHLEENGWNFEDYVQWTDD